MIRVFYDGHCGMCAKEIGHYQRVAPAGVFEWIDITREPEPFEAMGYRVADGLRALHVQDAQGKMHIGVMAFVTIWRQLKHWRLLAFFAGLPGACWVLGCVYTCFAAWRFKRLGYHCDE